MKVMNGSNGSISLIKIKEKFFKTYTGYVFIEELIDVESQRFRCESNTASVKFAEHLERISSFVLKKKTNASK